MKQFFRILPFVFSLCATVAFAQVNFGVKAGLNLATMNLKGEFADEIKDLKKSLLTFQVGGVLEFNLTDNIALQPGLMLVGKGLKLEEGDAKATTNPIYLQVPVLVLYKQQMFYIGAGPYVGFGLFGKAKEEFAGEKESNDLNFGNGEDDDFAPLDFGLLLEGGVILNQIRIGAGYGLGLSNVYPSDARGDDDSAKHGIISLNVAYMFGGQ